VTWPHHQGPCHQSQYTGSDPADQAPASHLGGTAYTHSRHTGRDKQRQAMGRHTHVRHAANTPVQWEVAVNQTQEEWLGRDTSQVSCCSELRRAASTPRTPSPPSLKPPSTPPPGRPPNIPPSESHLASCKKQPPLLPPSPLPLKGVSLTVKGCAPCSCVCGVLVQRIIPRHHQHTIITNNSTRPTR